MASRSSSRVRCRRAERGALISESNPTVASPSPEASLLRTIEQLRHAADLAEASSSRSLPRAAGHIVAILDDLQAELDALRSIAA